MTDRKEKTMKREGQSHKGEIKIGDGPRNKTSTRADVRFWSNGEGRTKEVRGNEGEGSAAVKGQR